MTLPNSDVPKLKDNRSPIVGLLPQNTQALVLGGIAVLMVLIMVFSGRAAPKPTSHPTPPPTVTEPSQPRIQEYRQKLEHETQELALEEARLQRAKSALRESSQPDDSASSEVPTHRVGHAPDRYGTAWTEESRDIAKDRAMRDYRSLFAPNIALTYRPSPTVSQDPKPGSTREAPEGNPAPINRQMPVPPGKGTGHVLYEGTILETVLTNRLDSTFSGPVKGMVTTNVYSSDGPTLVIPQGTFALGEVRKLENLGQQRLAVVFHRLVRPDGTSVVLDQFTGLSQIGETGLKDQVNHHYAQIFGASLAIGAIAGLTQANTRYGANGSPADAYQQGVSTSLSQSALHILDHFLNVLPTFTIREGQRIKVYLSQDLRVPAYPQPAEIIGR